jgi:hypothetical protein
MELNNCYLQEKDCLSFNYFFSRKTEGAIERAALDWNPQGARRRGRPRKTWKKTVEEESAEMGKTWKEVKRSAKNRTRWRCFTDALCSS